MHGFEFKETFKVSLVPFFPNTLSLPYYRILYAGLRETFCSVNDFLNIVFFFDSLIYNYEDSDIQLTDADLPF